jgi:hypothetical protein
LHALFTGEDNTWEAWLNADASGFSNVINFGSNGIKLRRGYAPSLSPKPTQVPLFMLLGQGINISFLILESCMWAQYDS